MLPAPPLLAVPRAALFGACDRSLNAIVRKGSRRCWKAVRDVDNAHDIPAENMPADIVLAREVRKLLRARCGLCQYRPECRAPLDMA